MWGKKEKILQYELRRGKETIFLVRVGSMGVEIESASKDWSVSFGAGTYETAMINHLIQQKQMETLMELARSLFVTRMVFSDVKLVKEIWQCIERSTKRQQKAAIENAGKQSDAEILAEEKVLHEQTSESINELEKIKKDGTKKK